MTNNILGPAFINATAGFAAAVMLATLGVPMLILLIAQAVLVIAARIDLLVTWRRDKRDRRSLRTVGRES